MPRHWDPANLPDLDGRTVVVTGASSGIGYFATLQLAAAGAHVVLAVRSVERGERAVAAVRDHVADAALSLVLLDTSSFASVAATATRLSELDRFDALICNAAMVFPPESRADSVDGNEIALATNFLGHFALVQALLPALARSAGRVVMTGSLATRFVGRTALRDLQLTSYSSRAAYARSKLATEAFGFELARRLRMSGSTVSALVAHPGTAADPLSPSMPNDSGQLDHAPAWARRFPAIVTALGLVLQGKDAGAWPLVRAAVDTSLPSGAYVLPRRRTAGRPVVGRPPRVSCDPEAGARVWALGEAARAAAAEASAPPR